MFGNKSIAVLSAIGFLSTTSAQNTTTTGVITQDTVFYGQSPPHYPSPQVANNGLFAESVVKAKLLVGKMTLEEKVNLTGGVTNPTNGCGGNIPAVARLGFPGLCLTDGPTGVRGQDLVNGYAAGIHTGAR
jgi:beta-glucosidase